MQARGPLILLVTLLLGLLALEGATRVFIQQPEPVVPPVTGQFDAELGWLSQPLTQGVSNRTGYPIEYQINSKGLRDSETTYEKPPDVFRIVILGDSRTFGYGVPIEKHFTTLIEGYFEKVEVINMGVRGFGVDQELLYLRSEGLKYDPDLVIAYVQHYANHRHMHTRRFGKQKPRFVLEDGTLVLTNSPVTLPTPERGVLQRFERALVRNSAAYRTFTGGLIRVAQSQRNVDARDANRRNQSNEQFFADLNELGEAIVLAIAEESKNAGCQFLLVTEIQALHDVVTRNEVPSLNVFKPLSNSMYDLPENLKHINEAGNGVLAWEIANFLQTQGIVPPEHRLVREWL